MTIDKEALRKAIPVEQYYRDQLGEPQSRTSNSQTHFCPFHPDKKTPNLVVQKDGRFKCFACNTGGDIFEFHKKRAGLSFADVLLALAQRHAPHLLNSTGPASSSFESSPRTSTNKTSEEQSHPTKEDARKFIPADSQIKKLKANGYEPTGLYEYCDRESGIKFWRARLDHPDPQTNKKWIKPLSCVNGKWQWKEPSFPDGKPLYIRTPEKSSGDTKAFYVFEGEKKVDAAVKLGLNAATSGGSNSAAAASWKPLRGSEVVIWPDNDEPGQKYADAVIKQMGALGVPVRLIDVGSLDLQKGQDIIDWLAANPGATKSDIEAVSSRKISPAPNSSPDIDSGTPHLTDSGNSLRFVKRHCHEVKFIHAWGKFLLWNGKNWAKDDSGKVYELAIKTALSVYAEAANQADLAEQKKIVTHARNSQSKTRLDAMLGLAKHQVAISPPQLDEAPYLFNCSNGTIDLKTGELLSPDPSHLLTKISLVEFDPNAQCPIWKRFLLEVFNGNNEMVEFTQRTIGYALTGDTSEQCLFFLYGIGRNGKSTLIETLMVLLGDYSTKAEMKAFLEKKSDSASNDIACLSGARLVCAVESGRGRSLNESLVKELTGGDSITARFLYQEFFSFKPQFKLFLAGNSKPVIKGNDEGIWRRIRLLPFEVVIPKEKVDRKLPEKLLNELPGILAWAVRGCLDWQKNGLREPKIVVEATSCYREEMDLLADFFSSEVIQEAFSAVEKGQIKVSVSEIYKRYTAWCELSSVDPVKKRTFGIMMNERGFPSKSVFYQSIRQRVYNGIGLREQTNNTGQSDYHGTEGTELPLDSGNFKVGNLVYKKKPKTSVPSVPSVPKENKKSEREEKPDGIWEATI